MMMEYITVKNIEKYHPGYKDRKLVWCKTYFTMLNADPEFELLCEIDKWRFVAFVMLQLQIKKPVPLESSYLARKGFDLKKRPIALTLKMLQNFVERVTPEKKVRALDKEEDKEQEEDKEKEYKAIFEQARSHYPGRKRGIQTEFDNFRKKHKDWRQVVPYLWQAVENQIAHQQQLKTDPKAFVPEWKHFQTWINQRCWEEELPEIKNDLDSAERQAEYEKQKEIAKRNN
jgi:hypothetical protein